MIGKKGQFTIVGEIFSFLTGIFVLISIVSLFTLIVNPRIENHSAEKQAKTLLYHTDFLITQVYSQAIRSSYDSQIEYSFDMPEKIINHDYNIYFEDEELCIFIFGLPKIQCMDSAIPNDAQALGNFISSDKIIITAQVDDGRLYMGFTNV